MKFKNKPRIIDAERFLDPENPPRGVLETPTGYDVLTAQGRMVCVAVGEWIVAEDGVPGRYYPIIDADGAPKGYELIDGQPTPYQEAIASGAFRRPE